jgi:guanylate kinase
MNPGRIIIISGPSGSGKTTLHKKLLASRRLKGKVVKSISATTRPRRENEIPGRDYIFLGRADFLKKKRAGYFLESQKVFDFYYGTPATNVKKLLRTGKYVLLCIDVKGAKVVWRKHPDALKIFIKTPTLNVLKERLRKRGTENSRDLALRLRTARQELQQARHYDYVLVNDDLGTTCARLEKWVSDHIRRPKAKSTD